MLSAALVHFSLMLRDKNLISTNKEKNGIAVERNLSAFCNSLRILRALR